MRIYGIVNAALTYLFLICKQIVDEDVIQSTWGYIVAANSATNSSDASLLVGKTLTARQHQGDRAYTSATVPRNRNSCSDEYPRAPAHGCLGLSRLLDT